LRLRGSAGARPYEDKKEEAKMKILAVCGFGCGSSMLLKMSIDKVSKKLAIECETDISDISSAKGASCDAIFTSAELAPNLKGAVPVYSVNKYMDLNEVEDVFKQFISDTQNKK
jgi:PTS system ascorbate-specific IIB component